MPRNGENVDKVREIAERATNGSISALTAARLIVRQNCLLIPTAVTMKGRDPSIMLTSMDLQGNTGWKAMTTDGKALPVVRGTSNPEAGIWCVSDPNGSGQRLRVGGAGVTNANYEQFGLGVGGWHHNDNNRHLFNWHPIIAEYTTNNPDQVMGTCDVIVRDESFRQLPRELELPGHFVSTTPEGHETIASFPIIGREMLRLSPVIFPHLVV